MAKLCSIQGCGRKHEARGWCNRHYQSWLRSGDPLKAAERATPEGEPLAFLLNVVMKHSTNDCLTWPYSKNGDGRGKIFYKGKVELVHRVVLLLRDGPPPSEEHEGAHSCGKGHEACVAPGHLRWSTHAENLADRVGHGTDARGEKSALAKLSNAAVMEIKSLAGTMTQTALAARFGVSPSNVNKILRGVSRVHQ